MRRIEIVKAVVLAAASLLAPPGVLAQSCMRNPVFEVSAGYATAFLAPSAARLAISSLPAGATSTSTNLIEIPGGKAALTLGGSLDALRVSPNRRIAVVDGSGVRISVDLDTGRHLARWALEQGKVATVREVGNRYAADHYFVPRGGQSTDYRTTRIQLVELASGRIVWDQADDTDWRTDFNSVESVAVFFEPQRSDLSGPGRPDIGGSRSVRVIDLQHAKEMARLREDFIPTRAGASPDGRLLATSTWKEMKVRLRSLPDGKLLAGYEGYGNARFLADGRLLLFGSNGPAALVDLAKPSEPVPAASRRPIIALTERPGGRIQSGQDAVLDAKDLRLIVEAPAFPNGYRELRVTPDGKRALVRQSEQEWQLVDTADGSLLCSFLGDRGSLVSLANDYVLFGKDRENFQRFYSVLRLEGEGAARAQDKTEREAALAASGQLSPQDRTRAQNIFKQAFDLFQAGEFEAAIIGFQRGLALDPASGLGHYYLAETYARQNKSVEARTHYRKAIEFAPDSKEAMLAQARLDKL